MKRKGLGKGLGRGYRNLVYKDPYVHSMSARGMKTYTKDNFLKKLRPLKTKTQHWDLTQYIVNRADISGEQYGRLAERLADADVDVLTIGDGTLKFTILKSGAGDRARYQLLRLDKSLNAKSISPERAEVREMKDDLAQQLFNEPYKKLTPDKKSEVEDAYNELVFKLSAKSTREVMRKGFNTVLAYKVKGVPLKADVKINKLNPEDIIGVPDIVMKDKNGSELRWVSIDAGTGKVIGKNVAKGQATYRRVLMNEKDEIVPRDQVVYYQKSEGKLKKVQPFEPTIGKNRQITIDKVLPKENIDNYLIESTYQLVGQKEEDDADLYLIAKDLYDKGQVGIVPIVFREGFKKEFGIITPVLFKDRFSVIVRMTRAKIEPTELKISTKQVKKEKLPTIKTKSPF